MMKNMLLLLSLLLLPLLAVENCHASYIIAFQPAISSRSSSSSSSFALFMAKKRGGSGSGKNSLRKTVGGVGSSGGAGMGVSTTSKTSYDINWCPMPPNQKDKMPTIDGKVALLDTELPTMKNSATNPTGAVAVTKLQGQTYCFSSSCPCCQVPLTKAQILPPVQDGESGDGHARLVCDLCKSTYSLGTGQKLVGSQAGAASGGGILSSVVKSLFSANKENAQRPLKLYKLGEKGNGQLVIAVD